jgi:hypothetical protein
MREKIKKMNKKKRDVIDITNNKALIIAFLISLEIF